MRMCRENEQNPDAIRPERRGDSGRFHAGAAGRGADRSWNPVEKALFTLTIDHGVKPENGSYAFAILPGATPEETANWKSGRILANDDTCQAVEFNDGTVGAIFQAPGKLGRFETKAPGAFLIEKKQVFAADPTARLSEIRIALDGVSRRVRLPGGEQTGSSVATGF